jgi:hypothetical protein
VAKERCIAALQEAQRVRSAMPHDSLSKDDTARFLAVEKQAFGICTGQDVPVDVRNEAIVRWAGLLNDPSVELALLKKTLRETEASEGPDSKAMLPLLDRFADLYGAKPSQRSESLELLQRGLRIRKNVFGESSVEAAQGLLLVGAFWEVEEMPDRNVSLAEQYYREAVAISEKACGPNCEALRGALGMLHSLIEKQHGREAEAGDLWKRLERLHYEARIGKQ